MVGLAAGESHTDSTGCREQLIAADDHTLIEALAAGDPSALALLKRRFGSTVERILRLTLGSRTDSEALAETVYASVVGLAASKRKSSTLKELVVTATISVCREEGRRRRADRVARAIAADTHVRDEEAADASEGQELVLAFRGLLMGVRPGDRACLVVRLIETLESNLDIRPEWGLLASNLIRGTA